MIELNPSRKMEFALLVEKVATTGEEGAETVVVVVVDGLGETTASGANLTLFFDGLLVVETIDGDVISGVVGAATSLVTIVN
jgi:hypothetical protein